MRIRIANILKSVCLFIFLIFMLTACTSKEDIILELDVQGKGETPDTESVLGTETVTQEEYDNGQQTEAQTEKETADAIEENLPDEIYVHICGAVVKPGVYKLAAGSRAFEGIEAAGGFNDDACEDFINQAKPLQDGQRLVIPTVEEAKEAEENGIYNDLWMEQEMGTEAKEEAINAGNTASVSTDGRININTADENELMNINGIGAGKAAAIVQYRQENGSFVSTEDIMKVSGIGESTYEKIKEKITVN